MCAHFRRHQNEYIEGTVAIPVVELELDHVDSASGILANALQRLPVSVHA